MPCRSGPAYPRSSSVTASSTSAFVPVLRRAWPVIPIRGIQRSNPSGPWLSAVRRFGPHDLEPGVGEDRRQVAYGVVGALAQPLRQLLPVAQAGVQPTGRVAALAVAPADCVALGTPAVVLHLREPFELLVAEHAVAVVAHPGDQHAANRVQLAPDIARLLAVAAPDVRGELLPAHHRRVGTDVLALPMAGKPVPVMDHLGEALDQVLTDQVRIARRV